MCKLIFYIRVYTRLKLHQQPTLVLDKRNSGSQFITYNSYEQRSLKLPAITTLTYACWAYSKHLPQKDLLPVFSACEAVVKCRPFFHHCVVIFVWSSGILECMLFTFENRVPR